MARPASPIFFHVGLATRDIDRAVRFYTAALDFEHYRTVGAGTKIEGLTAPASRRKPVEFLTRGDFMIELTANGVDETAGAGGAAGLHHLSFLVENLDDAITRIREHGGGGDPAGKLDTPDGPMVFCTDPDGVKLELWERMDFPPPDQPK